jgi:hypothetical protein
VPYMTRTPSDLGRFGLKVELVPGWETRGSASFAPACVVDHWTAGPRGTSGRPSLNVVTYGRKGLAGPLCNVYLDRRGVCVVVAAGRANHAGAGGFRGLVGNSAAYGIEAECGGDGDWTPEMLAAYPRLNAALLSGLGRDASWVASHSEWAPARKIDIRDVIAQVRANTATVLADPQEDDMPTAAEIAKAVWDHRVTYGGADAAARLVLGDVFHHARRAAGLAAQAATVDVDEAALARELAPLLAPAVVEALGGDRGLTQEQVEAAIRRVLGSLDESPA